MSENILTIRNVSKSFPKVIANNNVSFNIKKNTVHALLGENGAGKSTLVKILYGLLKSDEGEITFNNRGIDVDAKPETVTEENLAPVTEAKKEEAPKTEAKTEKKLENSPEKK